MTWNPELALEGCRRWQQDGLGEPPAVRQASEAYFESNNNLGMFIEECVSDIGLGSTKTADVHKAYRDWCFQNGERPVDGVGKLLEKRFGKRTIHGTRFYVCTLHPKWQDHRL